MTKFLAKETANGETHEYYEFQTNIDSKESPSAQTKITELW